jgi:hypothetical protein
MQIKKSLLFRHQQVQRIRHKIEAGTYPRLMMAALLVCTSCAGFVVSYVLLQLGIQTIWIRYVLAFCISYLVFLSLLWIWLRLRSDNYTNLFDSFSGDANGLAIGSATKRVELIGQGGSFDGGGASADWGEAVMPDVSADVAASGLEGVEGAVSSLSDADEVAVPFVLLVLVGLIFCSLAIAAGFVIYSAPLFFAELLFDGVFAASLYKRLGGFSSRHWLETALQRTWLPFLAICFFFAIFGWGIAHFIPGAISLADVVALIK